MRKLFGTDGVRGKANLWPMTSEVALKLGRGLAHIFKNHKNRKVVIGKDTRRSGYMLENALSSGVCSAGAEAILLGPLPTPAIAFITAAMRADAGAVISASHNPYYDNGIKFFDHTGFKLPDEKELELEAFIESGEFEKNSPVNEQIGKAYRVDDAPGRYIEHLKSTFPKSLKLDGLKIVIDCANGAAYKVSPIVFEELGAQVIRLGVNPNGFNINENCGALHPEGMAEKVRQEKADLGIALDGDADRVILCDEHGKIVDGDTLIAIAALEMKKKAQLKHDTVVATVMSNFGLERCLKEAGIRLLRASVGDRYVMETMREHGLNLGGEQSGHIIFSDHATTGDGTLAALQILSVMKKTGSPLSQLKTVMTTIPQVLLNLKVKEKKPLESLASLQNKMKEMESRLSGKGRVLLRYSGTENLLRIMAEAEDEVLVKQIIEELKEESLKSLGAAS